MKIDAVAYAASHINKLAACGKHDTRALRITCLIESSVSKCATSRAGGSRVEAHQSSQGAAPAFTPKSLNPYPILRQSQT